MSDIKKRIIEEFGNKLRIRVCGLCFEDEKVLMVNHQSLNENEEFWAPPGGGMDYSESAEENLKREFLEETGINVEIEKFLYIHEYLSPPLHAIELFFLVKKLDGKISIGIDPEMAENEQIIKDVDFMTFDQIKYMKKDTIHQLFRNFETVEALINKTGYFLYKK